MALNKVAICNLALKRLRIGRSITSLTESTAEARACNDVYEFCRQEVLTDKVWPFAVRETTLALVEEEPSLEWAYSYRIPSDCLRLDRLVPNTSATTDLRWPDAQYKAADVLYRESSDASGRLLFTNEEDPILLYTVNIDNEALFLPSFGSALAYKIAMEIGGMLGVDDAILGRAEQGYYVEISKAHAKELNANGNSPTTESSFITAGY
jgi:hypothetical protein